MGHGIDSQYSIEVDKDSGEIAGMHLLQSEALYMASSCLMGKVIAPPPTRWQRFKRWVRSIW